MALKIDEMEEGQVWEMDGMNPETEELQTVQFRITEVGWFPSPVKPGVFIRGVKCDTMDEKHKDIILFFLCVEFARQVS